MLSRQNKSVNIVALPDFTAEEKKFQQERLRDVYLLLENLALNEEATIKLIIDCLYDIGIINIINKKIPHRSMNRLAKFIASTPKPLIKIIAWQWVRKNLPHKVTNWLHHKVQFK